MPPAERARSTHHMNFPSMTFPFSQSLRTAIPDLSRLDLADSTYSTLGSSGSRRFSAHRSFVVVLDFVLLLLLRGGDLLDRSLDVLLNEMSFDEASATIERRDERSNEPDGNIISIDDFLQSLRLDLLRDRLDIVPMIRDGVVEILNLVLRPHSMTEIDAFDFLEFVEGGGGRGSSLEKCERPIDEIHSGGSVGG